MFHNILHFFFCKHSILLFYIEAFFGWESMMESDLYLNCHFGITLESNPLNLW